MIDQLVEQIEARHAEAQAAMSDPAVIGDRKRLAEAGRRYRTLEPAARLAEEGRRAQDDLAGAQELLDEGGEDAEVREMLDSARTRIAELEEEIRLAMVETDPNDDKDVIVEIRAGAGGDEAGLWAGDLFKMLTRYAERRGYKTDTMAAMATASSAWSGSRVVSFCSCMPGHMSARTQPRVRLRPAALMSSNEMPAISGTPTMRVATRRYQAGSPTGAKTKIATTMTISRKLVPQRGCRRLYRAARSGTRSSSAS